MSEFEKEFENVKYSDFDLRGSKRYSCYELIEHFKDWQPHKPLVVVPQIVARYIETEEDNDYNRVGTLVYGHYTADDRGEKHSELHEWIAENFDTFLEAIVNGYTVEKEQKYLLKHIDFCKTDKHYDWFTIKFSDGPLNHLRVEKGEKPSTIDCKFTKQEIDSMETGSYEQIPVEMSDNGI